MPPRAFRERPFAVRPLTGLLAVLLALVTGCAQLKAMMSPGEIETEVRVPATALKETPSSITVHRFDTNLPGMGEATANAIRSGIAGYGFIPVVGQGGSAEVRGRIDFSGVRTTQYNKVEDRVVVEDFKPVSRTMNWFYVTKEATSTIRYSVFEGGRQVAGGEFSKRFSESWDAGSPQEALGEADADSVILGTQAEKLAGKVVKAISPHTEVRTVPLARSTNSNIQTAFEYLTAKRYDQALAILGQVWQKAPEAEDRAAARYNMGAIHEIQGDYAQAFEAFADADQESPGKKLYIEAMTRVEDLALVRVETTRQLTRSGLTRLTVVAQPGSSRIRIMNIAPAYQPGMELQEGRYHLVVDSPSFRTHDEWIELEGEERTIHVTLEPL